MTKVQVAPIVRHQAASAADLPITAERYISPQWLAREARDLWSKVWQFACLERDVATVGAFQVYDIGRESIVVSRSEDGLHAFYNSCQHRGMRIAEGAGCSQRFVCGYHGWTYRPDGRLVVVPDNDRFAGGVDRSTHSLQPVRVDTFAGLVFICMDPNTMPLTEYLGLAGERIAAYRLQDMTHITDQTVRLACNWKAVYDNFGELYHVEHIHPQHQELFDCPTARVDLYANGHTSVAIDGHTVNRRFPIPGEPNFYMEHQLKMFGVNPADYAGRVLDVRADMQQIRRAGGARLGFDYSQLSDDQLTDIEQYNLFPNIMITLTPETGFIARSRPHATDPDWCSWDKFTFRMAPSADVARRAGVAFEPYPSTLFEQPERPVHDEFDQEDVIAGRKTMGITIDQDVHYIRDVQKGMHSRGFRQARLCDEEARIQHYHDWLTQWMGDAR
jgi:phenylpropionate dioxygenase-like ring-hydroxylating dioxygenase large terminal subunit